LVLVVLEARMLTKVVKVLTRGLAPYMHLAVVEQEHLVLPIKQLVALVVALLLMAVLVQQVTQVDTLQ
jgi:hypothetical protein